MRNKEIEAKLRREIKSEVPDKLDDILFKCERRNEVILKRETRSTFYFKRMLAYSCSFILVLVLGIFGLNIYNTDFKTDSTIEFDVNPSIELQVNSKNKITKTESLNDDGEKILSGMDLRNSDLNIAVNAIIGSMYKEGYISEIKNSILVSVKNKNKDKSEELQKTLQSDINEILDRYSIKGSVITQEIIEDEKTSTKASEAGISEGKTKYIEKILDSGLTNKNGEPYTFDTLSKLTINELNVILEAKNKKVENVTTSGKVSTQSYISKTKAKNIALKDAKLTKANIKKVDIELDYKNNIMMFEVEFKYDGAIYNYEIDAASGKILEKKKNLEKKNEEKPIEENKEESKEDNNDSNNTSTLDIIAINNVKKIVLEDASINEASIKDFQIEVKENMYEVSFKFENYEYIYKIDANNENILEKKKESIEDNTSKEENTVDDPNKEIEDNNKEEDHDKVDDQNNDHDNLNE